MMYVLTFVMGVLRNAPPTHGTRRKDQPLRKPNGLASTRFDGPFPQICPLLAEPVARPVAAARVSNHFGGSRGSSSSLMCVCVCVWLLMWLCAGDQWNIPSTSFCLSCSLWDPTRPR